MTTSKQQRTQMNKRRSTTVTFTTVGCRDKTANQKTTMHTMVLLPSANGLK